MSLFRRKDKGTQAQTETLKEIHIGGRIVDEITRVKKGEKGIEGKVTVGRVKTQYRKPGNFFVKRGKALYFVDTEKLKFDPKMGRGGSWKVQHDQFFCEPIGDDGRPHYSRTLGAILRDETITQMVDVAQAFIPFELTRGKAAVLLFAAIVAALAGFVIPGVISTGPNTVIHWVPST